MTENETTADESNVDQLIAEFSRESYEEFLADFEDAYGEPVA